MVYYRFFRFFVILFGVVGLTGCAGRGTVYTIPIMRKDFSDQEPIVQGLKINEAWWWTNETGELNIALRYVADSLFGKAFSAEWSMSLVLDGSPAGSERLYRLGQREVRISQSVGADHRQSCSLMGVAVIEAARHGRLKGRYHVTVRQQQFSVLTGWSPPISRSPLFLVAGEFEALHDPDKGRAILLKTEANGFDRSEDAEPFYPAASRPALPATAPSR